MKMSDPNQWRNGPLQATPEEVGFDASRLERLDEIFGNLLTTGKVQCASYCLARHGRVFAHRSIGPRHFEKDLPLEPSSFRAIASVGKVFTSIGILKLVEDGRILMEFPIGHYLKEFDTPAHAKIRLSNLLTHSSGLPADPGSNAEPNPDYGRLRAILSEPDWVARLAKVPLAHEPGERWCYGSAGFSLLGEIISRTVGEPYDVWMEREIFKPAGLQDTYFHPGDRDLDNICLVSRQDQEGLDRTLRIRHRPMLAMGGAYSTVLDMVRLGQLFLEGGSLDGQRILGRKTIESMHRIHLTAPAPHWGDHFPDWQYGLGLEPARHPLVPPGSLWGHEGSGRSAMWFAPEEGLSAAWILPTTIDWDPDFCWTPRAVIWSGLH